MFFFPWQGVTYKCLQDFISPPVLMAKTKLWTALVNQMEIFPETRRQIPNMEVSLGCGPLILVSISSSRHRGAFISGGKKEVFVMMSLPDHPTQTIKLNLREAWWNESSEVIKYQTCKGLKRLLSLITYVRNEQRGRDLSKITQPVRGGLFPPRKIGRNSFHRNCNIIMC